MYAIVDIAGQQFRVEKDKKIFVHRLEGATGSKVDFDKVLLIEENDNITVGAPVIEGAMIYASILDHLKGDKVLIFKKKRRKGYRKKNGHRQQFTQILIEDIITAGAKKRLITKEEKPAVAKEVKKAPEKEVKAKATPTKEVKKVTAKPAVKKVASKPAIKKAVEKPAKKVEKSTPVKKSAPVKKAAPKKAAPKKAAPKKAAPKKPGKK